MIIEILIMVLLGIGTNGLATLRTILVAKKAKKPVYVLTFIDAMLFGTVLKQIGVNGVISLVIAYAAGRVIGYFIGDMIEDKMALGNSEIEMSLNSFEKMVEIADELRDQGFSVETYSTYGYKGKRRYKIVITTQRKNLKTAISIVKKHGYDDPTLKIRDVQKLVGKFTIAEK